MERDELKDIWMHDIKEMQEVETTDLTSVYTSKSTNMVDKIVSTMRVEQTLNYILFPPLVIYFFLWAEYWYAAFSFVLGVSAIVYYHKLLVKLKNTGIEHSVTDYLNESYQALKSFRNHYLSLGIVCFLVGFFITSDLFDDLLVGDYQNLTKEILSFLGISFLAILMAFIIFYLMYGKKLNRLKRSIRELENS